MRGGAASEGRVNEVLFPRYSSPLSPLVPLCLAVMIVPTWRDSSGGGGRWAARSAAAPTPTPAPAAAPPKRVPFSKRVADLFLDDTPEADFTHSAAAAALAAAAATPSPAPPPAPASAPTAAASSVHSSAQVTPLKRPSDMSASAKSPSRRRGGGGASSLVGGRRLDRVGAAGPDAPLARLGGVEVLRRPNPMREDIPSNHKLTDPVAMSNIEARTLTEFDALFRQKNYSMGMLVTVELALMILVFQYPWNATTGHYDSEATSVWVLQTVLTFLTAWHLWKVWDYYQLVLVSDRVKYALRSRDGILQSFRLKYMLVEMLLVLLHSVPYVMETKPELFIFGRMYQLFRVVRDHSPVYRWRKQILTRGHLSGLPEFDVSLTLRTYFHLYPWPTLFIFISWWLLVLSYAVYIFERELQPTKFGFANTVYFTAGTMTALGYGDMVPISDGGRTVSLVAVVVGILCSALLVTALLRQIRLTPNQVRIAEFVAEEQLMREERAVAARLIQKAWRKFVAHRREQAREGVEIMMVTDDGIARLKPQEARARQARTHGLCHTSCCGMYDQPPTDQEVLNAAKKNRELR